MRTIVFIDYWNLQLSLQYEDAKVRGMQRGTHRFNVDWFNVGGWITTIHREYVLRLSFPLHIPVTSFMLLFILGNNRPAASLIFLPWIERMS